MATTFRPTIHLNGTSKAALLDGYCEAGLAVRKAIDALCEDGAPNGRDYYTQGPDAIRGATSEHVARLAALQGVLADLEALAEHVADYGA